MSTAFRFVSSFSVGALLLLPLVGQAQSGDRLEQIKRLNRVAAQKAETDIRDAIKEALPLIKTDPSGALEVLDAALHTAENDPALEEPQRDSLKRLITKHISEAKAAGGKGERDDANSAPRKEGRTNSQRKDDEGAQRIKDVRDRFDRTRDQLREKREVRGEQQRGLTATAKDTEESAIPSDKDMKFPKNWKTLVAKRSGPVEMTKAEKAIMKALDTVIEANFDNVRFEDMIKYLEEKTGVTILLDKQAMDQQQVTYETMVRFRARKVTMRSVLRRVLADVGLTYFIKDEAIQVTSPDRAKETLTTRSYYIGDLVTMLKADLGPILNQQQVLDNANRIVEMIQTQVEPDSWSINNGPGRIFFEPARMVLVVKATAEVHFILGGGGK